MWLSHRGTTIKCSGHHIRLVLPEVTIPWDDLMRDSQDSPPDPSLDSHADPALPMDYMSNPLTGEHAFFDFISANAKSRSSSFPSQEERELFGDNVSDEGDENRRSGTMPPPKIS